MSTASFQHRTGQPHGGARRREASGAAPAASAALPRYLTSGKVTVTRRPRTDAAETAAGEAASRWTAQQGDQPIASGRVTGGSSAAPRIGGAGSAAARQVASECWRPVRHRRGRGACS